MNPAQLTSTLTREAERFAAHGSAGLDLDQVMARAGEIRRGRRMRASMVMAAVVIAFAVPIGVTALRTDGAAPHRPTHVAKAPDTGPLALGDYQTGPAPRTGYYADGALHYDGRTIAIPSGPVPAAVLRINGGFLMARQPSGGGDLVASFVGDDGGVLDQTWPTTGSLVATADRNNAALVQPDGTVTVVEAGGSRYWDLGKVPSTGALDVDAIQATNCSGRNEGVTCTVYVSDSGLNREVWAISPHVRAKAVLISMIRLDDISSTGLYAGMTSATDTSSCSEVVDGRTARQLWKTCDYSFIGFSPDGKHLLATNARHDGAGDSDLAIIDTSTWKAVLDLPPATGNFIQNQVWEDDSHVLASVYEHGQWAVERFGLDGSREYATAKAPDPQDSYQSPFKLG